MSIIVIDEPTSHIVPENNKTYITVEDGLSNIYLSQIEDIELSNLQNGESLSYNSTTQKWNNTDAGIGDMNKIIYDPNLVNGDTFAMDNMVEGSTNLILTSAERTSITDNTASRHNPTTVTDSATINFTITDQDITASVIESGIYHSLLSGLSDNDHPQYVLYNGATASIVPDTDITYDLGSATKRWRDLYLSGTTIKLGDATISSSGAVVQLPANSTINNQAISTNSDIGTTIQPYNVNTVIDASYVHTDNNYTTTEKNKLSGIATGAEVNTVDSVNTKTGVVVLNADDISDTLTTNKFVTTTDITNLSNLSGTNTGDITVTDSSEINFTLTNQDLTANIITGSIDVLKLDTGVQTSLGKADSALQSFTETDPVFVASQAFNITAQMITDLGNLSGSNSGDQSSSDFTHNSLTGLNDGATYQHITTTQETNFETAYSHSQIVTGNPHVVTKAEVGLGNVPNTDCTNASNITSGTLSSSVLPPVALTTVQVAVSEVAQLALTTEEGDVVVRSDLNKSYMRNNGTAGTMADFTELQTPTDSVLSVNGNTGTVVLSTADIADSSNKRYVTDAHLTLLGNTSGTNTGDNSANTLYANDYRAANFVAGTNYQAPLIADTDYLTPGTAGTTYQPLSSILTNTTASFTTTLASNIATNNAKVTNATHTGEVTGSSTLTIASNVVDEDNLKVTNAPTDNYLLSYDSTSGGFTWVTPGGTGTVTSVAISGSDGIEVDSGSPITSSGTIALGLNKTTTLSFLNVADGAEVNVQSDWNAVSGDAFILNKPTIPTQYTDELAQDAVGTILVDSSEIDFTYNDATPNITASLKAGSIDETKLDTSVNASLDLADSALQSSAIGTTVQAYDADLVTIGGLAKTDNNFIVGNGTTWVVENGATARTSLGLGSLATLSTVNNGNWSGTDLSVANGGTGASTLTGVLKGNGTSAITGSATIDDLGDGTTYKKVTAANNTKLGHISVTQAVDLDTMESNITTNNAKISFDSTSSSRLANTSGTNTGDQVIPTSGVDFDPVGTDNSDNNAVNTLYSGLVSNVSTNLSEGTATTTTVDVNSSDGTNATLVSASTTRAGLLTKAKFDEITANTAKVSFTWDYDYGDLINTPTTITAQQASDITTNNAKVTNATHTGEVTGSTALTIDKTAITGKTAVTAASTDYILISDTSDTGNLKKVLVSDLGSSNSINQLDSSIVVTDTGFNGEIGFTIDGDKWFIMDETGIKCLYSGSFTLKSNPSTNTAPTLIPNENATTTGVGGNSGEISLIAAGSEKLKITTSGLSLSSGATINEISTDGTLSGDSDAAVPTEKAVKTYVDNASPDVSTETLTAGEALVAGEVCYLKSDGKYWKTDADAEATTKGNLRIANATISADATGEFIKPLAELTTTGLTAGSTYYVSATAGGITATAPSTTGQQVRIIGYARSTTVFVFEPSQDYYEVA